MHRIIKINLVLLSFLLILLGCGDEKNGFKGGIAGASYFEAKIEPYILKKNISGRVSAYYISEVRPQVGGIILQKMFDDGAEVKKGQPLFEIDPAQYQAAFNSAKANLNKAKAAAYSANLLASRYSKLIKDKAVSQQEYDNAMASANQARANVLDAEAMLDKAKIELDYTLVKSPVDGIIGKSFVTVGTLVSPSQQNPLATVQLTDDVYVDAHQSATELFRLRNLVKSGKAVRKDVDGAKVTLTLPDGSVYSEPGKLLFSDITIQQSTGMYDLRAIFPNKKGELLPNLYVTITLDALEIPKAILIPQKTVYRDKTGTAFVYTLVEKVFKEGEPKPTLPPGVPANLPLYGLKVTPIEIEGSYNNSWVVIGGLNDGDKIVYDGVKFGIQTYLGEPLAYNESTKKYEPLQRGSSQASEQANK